LDRGASSPITTGVPVTIGEKTYGIAVRYV
jgi:hypothetical protein